MITTTWAVTPAVDDDMFRAAASIAGAGALTLLTNTVAANGCGYKLVITSTGNESAKNFTVVGIKVGDQTGKYTTETFTGTNATTKLTTNFYTYISSISIDAASAGDVKIGTSGSLALPRARIKAVYYVGNASAGTIKINSQSSTGTLLLQLDTPASATMAAMVPDINVLVGDNSNTDFAVVTLTNVALVTLFCS